MRNISDVECVSTFILFILKSQLTKELIEGDYEILKRFFLKNIKCVTKNLNVIPTNLLQFRRIKFCLAASRGKLQSFRSISVSNLTYTMYKRSIFYWDCDEHKMIGCVNSMQCAMCTEFLSENSYWNFRIGKNRNYSYEC